MTARVVIDLNVRVRGGQTFVGFEDIDGVVFVGGPVEVLEPESEVAGVGRVTEIDPVRELIYLDVDWASVKPVERTDTEDPEPLTDLSWDEAAVRASISQWLVGTLDEMDEAHLKRRTTGYAHVGWGHSDHLVGGAYVRPMTEESRFEGRRSSAHVALEVK